jgi:hypothetical protein
VSTLEALTAARFDRIEAMLRRPKPAPTAEAQVTRDLIIVMLALLVCVAGTLVGVRFPAPITIISAIALGVAGPLAYQ